MLEHVPAWLGHLLAGVRAGADKLAIADADLGSAHAPIALSSPAFADGARLPVRFTADADGDGVSPPLVWGAVPPDTRALALIVEDADSPTPAPIVHGIAWDLGADGSGGGLAEGALVDDAPGGVRLGLNSYGRAGWLPPDPPTGHGEHRYMFQLFALGDVADAADADDAIDPGDAPGRTALLNAMRGRVLGAGLLIGTYSRGEPASVPIGTVAPA